MRAYELRRGWAQNVAGDNLRGIAAETFGSAETRDGKVVASFGAATRITAWTDGKSLFVDTEMNPQVDNETAGKTITAFNRFLEAATGYNAKERAKKAQQSARAGAKEKG